MSQFNYKEIIASQLPYKAYKSNDLESNALGHILNKIQVSTNELELNTNPQTSLEKGIMTWEKFFGLTVNPGDTLDFRRARILSELIQYMSDENVIRKDEMETILSLYGGNPQVLEFPRKYKFWINYESLTNIDLVVINKIIKQIKPSYLDYIISYIKSENINIKEEHFIGRAKYKLSGRTKTESKKVNSNSEEILISDNYFKNIVRYEKSGRVKTKSVESGVIHENLSLNEKNHMGRVKYLKTGKAICGGGRV